MEQVGGAGGDRRPFARLGQAAKRQTERTSIFDIPQDGAELLQDGEATLQAVACVLDAPADRGLGRAQRRARARARRQRLPGFGEVLSEHGVDPGRVQGAWVVPPFILKDLNGPALRWHEVRGRMGPFLKNELWRRVDAEVRQGSAVAWETMGLMAENVVVVKHAQPWRKLLGDARARLSWPNIKAAARSGADARARRRVRRVAVALQVVVARRVGGDAVAHPRRPRGHIRRAADDVARRRDDLARQSLRRDLRPRRAAPPPTRL